MRVLHVDTAREMRGGQHQILHLLQGLAAAGHQSILLAPSDSELFKKTAPLGLSVRPLGLSSLASLSREVDLTHAHDGRGHTLAAVLARSPLVVARRVGFPVRQNPASRWKYMRATHYIAVSQFVKQSLIEADIPEDKICVVYDGAPEADPARPSGLVVAPASDDPLKGTALVREAAALAGLDVHFSRDLAEDLQRASLFVYVTYHEGLGSAALMAMSAGVPVLASRVGGLPEIVEDGKTGLLVSNTAKEIAAGMQTLLQDRSLAEGMAERGRQRLHQHFSLPLMVQHTIDVYQRLL